jgi:putative transcriptional regulator
MIARLALAIILSAVALLGAGSNGAAGPPMRSLAGELLVAAPDMRDPRFARTVIYMVRHDGTGAQGLVVNRPLREVPLARLLEQMRMDPAGATGSVRLHAGGPVEPLRVFVLHTSDFSGGETEAVKNGVSITFSPDVLVAMAAGKGPRRSRVVLGYAGWAPGQLEAEFEAGAWLRASADEPMLFDGDYEKKWERAQARQKIDL